MIPALLAVLGFFLVVSLGAILYAGIVERVIAPKRFAVLLTLLCGCVAMLVLTWRSHEIGEYFAGFIALWMVYLQVFLRHIGARISRN